MTTSKLNSVNASKSIFAKNIATLKYLFIIALAMFAVSCGTDDNPIEPEPEQVTNVACQITLNGGGFKNKVIKFDNEQFGLYYSDDYGYAFCGELTNFTMPNKEKKNIYVIFGIGYNPGIDTYIWDSENLTGVILEDPQGYNDDLVWLGLNGSTRITSVTDEQLNATIRGTYFDGDTGEEIQVTGSISLTSENSNFKSKGPMLQNSNIKFNNYFQILKSK